MKNISNEDNVEFKDGENLNQKQLENFLNNQNSIANNVSKYL